MLDVKFIRENPDKVKDNIAKRGLAGPQFDVDEFILIDELWRRRLKELEGLRAHRNVLSVSSSPSESPPDNIIEEARKTKEQIKSLESEVTELETKRKTYLEWFPNMLDNSVPVGKDENDNVEVRNWKPEVQPVDGELKDHVELGQLLDIIDTKQSALVSGSRFAYLKNEAVLLQYALFEHLKTKLLDEGFTPMIVPLLVKREALFGSSHFPGDEDQVYRLDKKGMEEQTDLYLVGSSEPALFAYYTDKVLNQEDLPKKIFSISTCFRTEVGSWGKDVRGIKRVHQFDKLEMGILCVPEKSQEMHEYLLSLNEWFLQSLNIPYRVLLMCSGDAGYFATSKKYDYEAWLPASKEYIELGSNTNAKDYQARRYNTKYKLSEGLLEYVHNLNDTGCAAGRTIIAILENYQQPNGDVIVPDVLKKYMHGLEIIKVK